jgi:GT2 family glycosyltransferase
VEAISGAFMMVRTEIARSVGGLPDELFMYHEDLAFALRVRRAGWKIRYLGDVQTIHHSGASRQKSSTRLSLLEGEVRVRLIKERGGPVRAALARPLFGFRSLCRLGVALLGRVLPGMDRLRAARPKAFDVRLHALHLLWTIAPGAADRMIPRADEIDVSVILTPRIRPPLGANR